MRKIIATIAIAGLALTSCQKKNAESDSNNSNQSGGYSTMSSGLSEGEMHNLIGEKYYADHGFDLGCDNLSDAQKIETWVLQAANELFPVDSGTVSPGQLTTWMQSAGMFNSDGTIKSSSERDSIMVALESNPDLHSAFVNIYSTTKTGTAFISYVHSEMGGITTLSADNLVRRAGYLDVLDHSYGLNGTVYSPKRGTAKQNADAAKRINAADAKAYDTYYEVSRQGGESHTEATFSAIVCAGFFSMLQAEGERKAGNM